MTSLKLSRFVWVACVCVHPCVLAFGLKDIFGKAILSMCG